MPLLEQGWEKVRDDPTVDVWDRRMLHLAVAMQSIPADYFKYYYFGEEFFREAQASRLTRAGVILSHVDDYWAHYREQAASDHPVLDPARSRGGIHELELAIDVMSAFYNDAPARLPVNLPNTGGALPGFDEDTVVEMWCDVDGTGAHPIEQKPLPHAVRGITQELAEYQRLAAARRLGGQPRRRRPRAGRPPVRPDARGRRGALRRPRPRQRGLPARAPAAVSCVLPGPRRRQLQDRRARGRRDRARPGPGRGGVGRHLLRPRRRGRGRAGASVRRVRRRRARRRDEVRHAAFRLAGVDWPEDEEHWEHGPGPPAARRWRASASRTTGSRCCAAAARTGSASRSTPAPARPSPPAAATAASSARCWWIAHPLGGRALGGVGVPRRRRRRARLGPADPADRRAADALRLRRRRVDAARLHPAPPGPTRCRTNGSPPGRCLRAAGAGDAVAWAIVAGQAAAFARLAGRGGPAYGSRRRSGRCPACSEVPS